MPGGGIDDTQPALATVLAVSEASAVAVAALAVPVKDKMVAAGLVCLSEARCHRFGGRRTWL